MTLIQEKIVGAVDKANGQATWTEVMNALEYPERAQALPAIRQLEASQTIIRVVERNPETGEVQFTVKRFVEAAEEVSATIESAD